MASRPSQNPGALPAWQRDSFFLDEVKGLSPFRLLEVSSHDDVALEQAVQAWAQMDADVKAYLQARLDYNLLIGLDELRRRLDRGNNHSASVRTGIRLLVQQNGGDAGGGSIENVPEEMLEESGFAPGTAQVPMDEASIDEDLDPAAAMAAFEALDNSASGVVEAPAPPKRKRAPAKKRTRRSAKGKANGVQVPTEILDEDGNPMQPPA